jgi:hypothetical protein
MRSLGSSCRRLSEKTFHVQGSGTAAQVAGVSCTAGYFDSVVDVSIDQRTIDPVTNVRLFKILYEIKHRANRYLANLPMLRRTGNGSR